MPDFKTEPIIIKEATVRLRKGENTIEDDNSSAYDSSHEYKFMLEEKSKPVLVQKKMDLF